MYERRFPFAVVVEDAVPEAWFWPQPGDGVTARTLSKATNRVSAMVARARNAILWGVAKWIDM
jgi:hypothetical protein